MTKIKMINMKFKFGKIQLIDLIDETILESFGKVSSGEIDRRAKILNLAVLVGKLESISSMINFGSKMSAKFADVNDYAQSMMVQVTNLYHELTNIYTQLKDSNVTKSFDVKYAEGKVAIISSSKEWVKKLIR